MANITLTGRFWLESISGLFLSLFVPWPQTSSLAVLGCLLCHRHPRFLILSIVRRSPLRSASSLLTRSVLPALPLSLFALGVDEAARM